MSEQTPTSEGEQRADEPASTEVVPPLSETADPPPPAPLPEPLPPAASVPEPPPPPPLPPLPSGGGPASATANRPEIPIAGAFAGGFVLALLLKRLAR